MCTDIYNSNWYLVAEYHLGQPKQNAQLILILWEAHNGLHCHLYTLVVLLHMDYMILCLNFNGLLLAGLKAVNQSILTAWVTAYIVIDMHFKLYIT